MTYRGPSDYAHKRRSFDRQRSGNRRFWKRYARRAERRGAVVNPGWLKYLINNP